MKIAILGGSGMLGSMLVDYLRQHLQVVATVRERAKMRPGPNVEHRLYYASAVKTLTNPYADCDWVINAIGIIPQRIVDEGQMYMINSAYPAKLVCTAQGKRIISIATDCVYSGKKGNYVETDPADPLDPYGFSKRAGEVHGINHIRCSIVGTEPYGHYSLLGWFLRQGRGAQIQGYTNHLWNGVTTLQFAKVCRGIIESGIKLPHVQHLVPADAVSKYELLCLFRESFKREDIEIEPVEYGGKVDRTLATDNPELNRTLWRLAGYAQPPGIQEMIQELAEARVTA